MKQKIVTQDAPSAAAFLSQAIVSSNLIFVSGQIHALPDNTLVGENTEERVAQIMRNIRAILHAAGVGFNSIVKATIYVTDMSMVPELNRVYPTYFREPFPARELVCVSALPLGSQLEISVIAAAHE